MANEAQRQSYDNVLKRLVQHQAPAIIPLLLGESCWVIGEENIEVLIPPRRTDRVYTLIYHEQQVTIDIECETAASGVIDVRLLIYHVLLLEKYKRPVISLLLYPFEVNLPTSPFRECVGDEEILTFNYRIVPLFQLDAQIFVQQRAIQVYGLLPAMQGVNDALLLQAIDEMVQFYQDDTTLLREELLCFRVLLARAKRLPQPETLRVERRIRMFDPLLEDDPWVQEKVAESEMRGELNNAREMVMRFVQKRFPTLTETARTKTAQLSQPETLNTLVGQLWDAADENAARVLLEAA